MLGEDFTFRVVNNSLQVYGKKNEASGFEWVGSIDERTCNYCDSQIGRQYRLGQFLPRLPAHGGCRCSWRIIPQYEPVVYAPTYYFDPNLKYPKVATQRIERLLKDLPEKDTEGIKTFRVQEDLGTFTWDHKHSSVAGLYNRDTQRISIKYDNLVDEKSARLVLYHETGHHVYFDEMDSALQDEWQSIWLDELGRGIKNTLPSDYAESNSWEGFAECYQTYHISPWRFEYEGTISNFMRKVSGESAVRKGES